MSKMNPVIEVVLCLCLFYGSLLLSSGLVRLRYLTEGFSGSGNSNKKLKKYREKWGFMQRLLLIPLFEKENRRKGKYRVLGAMIYLHLTGCLTATVVLVLVKAGSLTYAVLSACALVPLGLCMAECVVAYAL